MTLQEEVAKKLKAVRKEKELSLMQVYFKTGITATTLDNWELGLTVPTLKNIKRLANFYNISIDWLVGLSDIKYITRKK